MLACGQRQTEASFQELTACLVDFPPAFKSLSFFSCFSYCLSSSFCFWTYIFLKVTNREITVLIGSFFNNQGESVHSTDDYCMINLRTLTVVPPVVIELLVVQVNNICTDFIQETLVVGNNKKSLLPALKVTVEREREGERKVKLLSI